MVSICFLPSRVRAGPRERSATPPGQPRANHNLLTLDLTVATQMLMQVAVRDIGQMTDI
jgi:hypothetical protein